ENWEELTHLSLSLSLSVPLSLCLSLSLSLCLSLSLSLSREGEREREREKDREREREGRKEKGRGLNWEEGGYVLRTGCINLHFITDNGSKIASWKGRGLSRLYSIALWCLRSVIAHSVGSTCSFSMYTHKHTDRKSVV